jgi:hypothetical protein
MTQRAPSSPNAALIDVKTADGQERARFRQRQAARVRVEHLFAAGGHAHHFFALWTYPGS